MADFETTYGLGVKITGENTSSDNVLSPIIFTVNSTDRTAWLDGTDADGLNDDYKWIADDIDTDDTVNFPGWLHSAGGTDNAVHIEGKDAADNDGYADYTIKIYDPKAASAAVVLENGSAQTDENCTVTDLDIIGGTHVIAWKNNSSFSATYVPTVDEFHVVGNVKDEYTFAEMEGNDLDLSGESDGPIYITFRIKGAAGSDIWIEFNKTITLDTVHPTFTLTAEGA